MNYNVKDIFVQRATSNNTFEEYKLTIQPNSIVVTDQYGNLTMGNTASFIPELAYSASIAATAITASYAETAATASYAVSASYEIVFETSASHAEEADDAISASYVPNLYPQEYLPSASWASASISASYVPNLYPQEYLPSASWASASISASYVPDLYPQEYLPSASWASASISASYVPNLYPQEYLPSASWASASISASYAGNVPDTASYALQALSASWAPMPVVPESVASASWASSSISASFSTTASSVLSVKIKEPLFSYGNEKAWQTLGPVVELISTGSTASGINGGAIEFKIDTDDYTSAWLLGGKDRNTPFGGSGGEISIRMRNGAGSTSERVIFLREKTIFSGSVVALEPDPNVGGSGFTGSLTGHVIGNAQTATSASYARSASYVPNLYPQTEQVSASWASSSISASHADNADRAISASYASGGQSVNAETASYVLNAVSASYAPNLYPQEYLPSASWASASISASYVPNLYPQEYLASASWASASISASYAANVPDTASYALQALSASWAPQPVVPEFVASASWASSSISASYAPSTPSPIQTLTTIATSSNYGITCSFTDIKEYLSIGTGGVIYNFTCSNTPSAGQYSQVSLFIENSSTPTSSLVFPSAWTFIGTIPSSITASKNAYLNLEAFGTSIVATWGDQY